MGKLEDEINKLSVQRQILAEDYKEQIKVHIRETDKKYHNQNVQLQEEIIKRQEKIKEKENEIATLQQNSQKLTKEKNELEDKLNKKISELEIELTKKEKIIEVDKKVIYKYEYSNNLLQEQKEKLENELSNLKGQNQIIKEDLIRIQEHVKVNTEISQKQNSQLQEQIVKKQEIIKQKDNEITALQQSSQNLNKEKTELKEEITALQQ
ncbi:1028_t:CDS:2, partial [Rhizophagus irregularis]